MHPIGSDTINRRGCYGYGKYKAVENQATQNQRPEGVKAFP